MSRVLIVDDERNVLKTLSLVLQRHDYSVLQAQNGPDALKVLDQEPCDFVVSDIRMSPMDGYTLATQIHRKYPQIGIVFMSAFGFEDQNSNSTRMADYPKLTKPFNVTELVRILKEEEIKKRNQESGQSEKEPVIHIVFLGDAERNRDILERLESMGVHVEMILPDEETEMYIRNESINLFLIDEKILAGKGWKVLNTLDHFAPKKPVVVLVDQAEGRDPHTVQDLHISVLNRKTFFEDMQWTKAFIKQHITP